MNVRSKNKNNRFRYIQHNYDNFSKIQGVSSELMLVKNSSLNKKISLSILVITYKRPDALRDALISIEHQKKVSYGWEVIVMDNDPNSTIPEWLDKMNLDGELRYYRNKKNIGHEGNINRGVQLARGKWVALLHDDDILVHNYLKLIPSYVQKAAHWKKPLAYIRASNIEFDDPIDQQLLRSDVARENLRHFKKTLWIEALLNGYGPTSVNSCGSLVNRKAFIQIGGYNDLLSPIGDATLGMIFWECGYSIAETQAPMGFYRQGNGESANPDVIVDLIRTDYELREYMYQKNFLSRLFGCLFRSLQLYSSFQAYREKAKRYGKKIDASSVGIPFSKVTVIQRVLLKVSKGLFYCLYRPNVFKSKLVRSRNHTMKCFVLSEYTNQEVDKSEKNE